jgi:hypothetical protein
MKLEVEVVQEEGGLYRASAVLYPDVSVTGRTEKYLRSQPERA